MWLHLDIDITQGKFPGNDILTMRDVLNHEVQLGYVFDYDYELDIEDGNEMFNTTSISDSSDGIGMNEVYCSIIIYLGVIATFSWF